METLKIKHRETDQELTLKRVEVDILSEMCHGCVFHVKGKRCLVDTDFDIISGTDECVEVNASDPDKMFIFFMA